MEGGSAHYSPRTVEEVFRDFKGRRAGIVRALTTDVEDFFEQCDPEKENLCLYGFPNERWELNLPADEVPPELPDPAIGINFARDGMHQNDWISLVAVHSDSWLLSVSFHFGSRFGFDKADRKRLFNMMNEVPTIYEVVSGIATKEKPSSANQYDNKSRSNSKVRALDGKSSKTILVTDEEEELEEEEEDQDEDEDEDEDEHGETLCGACQDNYCSDEFWIFCEMCEKWFHGKCVKITPAKAEHIKHYKCPSCSNKRARP